ncbi:MAG TPA: hypothetical protein ENK91_12675 [Bacteroidetes bacterium]|nr:hypothetical protein [Bacteroidota bacterium]
MPNSFTTRHKGENIFNLFSTELSINDIGDLPIFLHEFYHHIQNTTTILGAERFNYFIQSLAHIAKLAAETDTFYLPLDMWIQKEDLMTTKVSKQLLEIYEHKLMWDYLEKKNNTVALPYTQFADKNKSVTVISLDYFGDNEWLPTPILVMKEADEFKGYVIGGFFVAESGAYGLEQFHN